MPTKMQREAYEALERAQEELTEALVDKNVAKIKGCPNPDIHRLVDDRRRAVADAELRVADADRDAAHPKGRWGPGRKEPYGPEAPSGSGAYPEWLYYSVMGLLIGMLLSLPLIALTEYLGLN